jgi:hypothetical protein
MLFADDIVMMIMIFTKSKRLSEAETTLYNQPWTTTTAGAENENLNSPPTNQE